MSEETVVAPPPETGLSAEQAESQAAGSAEKSEAQGQESGQASGASKPPVEQPVSQSSQEQPRGRLPSHFYNSRQTSKIEQAFAEIERLKQQIASTQKQNSSVSSVPPPQKQNWEEKYWTNPVTGTAELVEDKFKTVKDELKQEILNEQSEREQRQLYERSKQESDRLVLTNERAKTNPNFLGDIAAIFQKYRSLQVLYKSDPIGAVEEAMEKYDLLTQSQGTINPAPRKAAMASTQTGVNSKAPNEEALLEELQSITASLTPLNANDPKIVNRINEINVALEQLNA